MTKSYYRTVVSLVLRSRSSFAQGPSPMSRSNTGIRGCSHLQDHGIIIGYPDGTFGGKRALTRYDSLWPFPARFPLLRSLPQGRHDNRAGHMWE